MPGDGDAAARRTYRGVDGLRQAWLDWLQPWESYQFQIERVIDAGERVVVLSRDRGRHRDMDVEVESPVAAIWAVRRGRVSRAEFYASREQALEAAGLRE
jgi:ketosteroid isomerase-like protein